MTDYDALARECESALVLYSAVLENSHNHMRILGRAAAALRQAELSLREAAQFKDFWYKLAPPKRPEIERFYYDDARDKWNGPSVFMAGEALVRESEYNALAASSELRAARDIEDAERWREVFKSGKYEWEIWSRSGTVNSVCWDSGFDASEIDALIDTARKQP